MVLSHLFSPKAGVQQYSENAMLSSPGAFGSMGAWLRKTLAGEKVGPGVALKISAWYAAVRCISEDIGRLPIQVFRRAEDGSKEEDRRGTVPRLLRLSANDEMTSSTMRELMTGWALSWGNAFAEIERDGAGQPIALWPIHPSRCWLRRVVNDSGLGTRIVLDVWSPGVAERTSDRVKVDAVRLESTEFLHIRGFGDDPMCGLSVAQLAAETLGIALAAQTYGAAFFGNGATPGIVLVHPKVIDEVGQTALRESWRKRHGGANNSNNIAVLQEGIKIEKISVSPEEAQFLQCVVAETLIDMADGTQRRADQLQVGDEVIGWDNGPVVSVVSAVGAPPVKRLVRVRTSRGRTLTCTYDHPILAKKQLRTPGGRPCTKEAEYVKACDLATGGYVRVATGHVAKSGGNFEDAWFLGAMVGNGYTRSGQMTYSGAEPAVIERVRKYVESKGGSLDEPKSRPYDYAIKTGGKGGVCSAIRKAIKCAGLVDKRAHEKRVPESVMSSGAESWRGFLSGYLDTDGTVGIGKQSTVSWSSVSLPLLEDCRHLLSMLGVNASISLVKEAGRREVMGQMCNVRDLYCLYVCGYEQVRTLSQILEPLHPVKLARLSSYGSRADVSRYGKDNWLYDRVIAVEEMGEGETVGIEIAGCHTHVTNGIVSHNTRQFQVNEIARWFRIPCHKIQDMHASTNNNIEHQGIEYSTDTLAPWFNRWEQEIERKLYPENEHDSIEIRFNDKALTRGDSKSRAEYLTSLLNGGVITPNEARRAEDLDPSSDEGADSLLVQGAMTTLEKIAKSEPEPPKPTTARPQKPEDGEEPEDEDQEESVKSRYKIEYSDTGALVGLKELHP